MSNDATVVDQQAAGADAGAVSTTPSVIELSDDSLVKFPGSDKPTKYGEWSRDFQAKHTKANQDRSRFEKDLSARDAELRSAREEMERYRAALGQPSQREKPDPGAAFQDLPYVKGQEAAQLARQVQAEFDRRDKDQQTLLQVTKLIASKLAETQQALDSVKGRFATSDFQTKISKYQKELDLPEEAGEFLQELYSAYEGEDLDQEFPNIARKRWEQLSALVRTQDKKRLDAARQKHFTPGKGGQGTPSKPLDMSRMTPKEIADTVFPSLSEDNN